MRGSSRHRHRRLHRGAGLVLLALLASGSGLVTAPGSGGGGGGGTGDIDQVFSCLTGACTNVTVGTGQSLGTTGSGAIAATTATALAADPAACTAGQFANDIAANGTLTCATPASSGAPTGATYITQTPDATLSAEQALSALTTGLTIHTTTTGVLSTYAGASCTNQFIRSLNASGAATCATVADADLANNYSGVGACGANQWASTLNDNAAPTCTQPSFSNISGTLAHSALSGLTSGDEHTQYALLAGRAGGQTLIGGTAAGNDLTLQSTSNSTRGTIDLVDPANAASGTSSVGGDLTAMIFAPTGTWSAGNLYGYLVNPTENVSFGTPAQSAFRSAGAYTATTANVASGIDSLDSAMLSTSATANVPPFPLHDVRVTSIIQQTNNTASIASSISPAFFANQTIAAAGGDLSFVDPNQLGYKTISAADNTNEQLTVTGHGWNTGDGPLYVALGNKLCTGVGAPFASCSGLQAGSSVLPTGLAGRTSYWVVKIDANTIKLATSYGNAVATTPIVVDITANGTPSNVIGIPSTGLQGLRVLHNTSATSGKTIWADTMDGIHISAPSITGAGTTNIGHSNGIFIEEQSNASIATPCALCSVGKNSPVKIAGKMQLGGYSDAAPQKTLEIDGDGGGILFDLDSATTTAQDFITVTDGVETMAGIWTGIKFPGGTITIPNNTSGFTGITAPTSGVYSYTAGTNPIFQSVFTLFNSSSKIQIASGAAVTGTWANPYVAANTFEASGAGTTATLTAAADYTSAPVFAVASSGAFGSGGRYGFYHKPTVNSGTIATDTGLYIANKTGAGTLTTQVGIDVESMTGPTNQIGIRNASTTVYPNTNQAITAATDTINCNSTYKTITLPSGSQTLTSNPSIADGQTGQICILQNVGANTLTLTDATKGMNLAAATRALSADDTLTLIYGGASGDWVEIAWADN